MAALLALSLLLMVLLAVYWQQPKCPECGAMHAIQDRFDLTLRRCARCSHIYRVRP